MVSDSVSKFFSNVLVV